MFFRRKKKETSNVEMPKITALLEYLYEVEGKYDIVITNPTDILERFLTTSGIEFRKPYSTIIIPKIFEKELIVDFVKYDYEEMKEIQAPPKSLPVTDADFRPMIGEIDILFAQIARIQNDVEIPEAVENGCLTKQQYIDALYARIDAIKHKEGLRKGLGLALR